MSSSLVVPAHDSTRWYTGLGLVEDAADVSNGIRSNSWVDGTLGTVGGSLDLLGMVVDPLGSLVSWGVAWLMEHVKPLSDALDWLAGNPDEIAAHAATWTNVANATAGAREEYLAAVRTQTQAWLGAAGDAYRGHAAKHDAVMQGISLAATGIAYAVEGAGLLVGLVRGIVRDLIADFVGTLAARLPQWLAEEGLTLGLASPVVIGQVAALVAKWANKIQHFVRGLLNSLRRLHPMLDKLGSIFDGLSGESRRLADINPLAPRPREAYTYNMVENPGPLAEMPGTPAANFAGGRYDEVVLSDDTMFYRGGDSQGSELGQWFTNEPPQSVAEVRIDTAVRAQWFAPGTGEWVGQSPIDTSYAIQIPAGTKVYPGPVANMGGVYVGGGHQVFVPQPWLIPDRRYVGSTPLP